MKALKIFSWCFALLVVMTATALAQQVQTDFDKRANFNQYRTYSWKKVKVNDQLWVPRIKDAVDSQLASKGWRRVDEGGDVTLTAIGGTQIEKTLDTYYNGFGGRRWRGFGGTSTTTVRDDKKGTLVVSIFDGKSNQLIWHGDAVDNLSTKADKNEKKLNKAVEKMFKKFPPQANA